MTRIYLFLLILVINCATPLDYFGNDIDLNQEKIYLTDLRENSNNTYILVFKGKFNLHSDGYDANHREEILNRYLKLIKKYYGFTKNEILNEELIGYISPLYFVTVKFE